jgi:hypothetical protein
MPKSIYTIYFHNWHNGIARLLIILVNVKDMTSKVGENTGVKGWPWKTCEDVFN